MLPDSIGKPFGQRTSFCSMLESALDQLALLCCSLENALDLRGVLENALDNRLEVQTRLGQLLGVCLVRSVDIPHR